MGSKTVTLRNGWQVVRVSAQEPCRICNHDSWCCHVVGGGSLCQRIESARKVGEAGWFHPDAGGNQPIVTAPPKVEPPLYGPMLKTQRRYVAAIDREGRWDDLIGDIGVDESVLRSFGVGWSAEAGAYSFPMRDGDGRIIGIRYRALSGRKWAVPGSRTGLFISETDPIGTLMLPEGPSDSAVLRELGFSVWGRPDARSGSAHAIHRLVKSRSITSVVVVGDDDKAGRDGAARFAKDIAAASRVGVRVVTPPTGLDVRQWVDGWGITAPMLTAYATSRELIHG